MAYYDFNEIKQIPIMDVCTYLLGLECVKRSGNVWCKTRDESQASTILHLNNNTFHDFGTGEHGDVIHLTSYVLGVSQEDAAEKIAAAFHIEAKDIKKNTDPNELADWEFAKIGIAGDRATKNFDFDFEKMSYERICEISNKYAMPVSTLRKKHPRTYEQVLRRRAEPFVRTLRNNYFLDVWARYLELSRYGLSAKFYDPFVQKEFINSIKELKMAESIFERAIHNTGLEGKFKPLKEYEPAKVLEKLTKGKLKPLLSTVSYSEISAEAEKKNTIIRYWIADYDKYITSDMDNHYHSAFFDSGRVVVEYLQSDYGKLKDILNQIKAQSNNMGSQQKEPFEKKTHKKSFERKLNYER